MTLNFPNAPTVGQQTPDGKWRWTGDGWEANVDTFRMPPPGAAGNIARSTGAAWESASPLVAGLAVPVSTIIFTAASGVPAGWLNCNGAALPIATYTALFTAIGYTWGGGPTWFNLPDCRGKFLRSYHDGVGQNISQGYGVTEGDLTRYHEHAGISGVYTVALGPFPIFTTANVGVGGTETRPINISLRTLIKF
jgi:phage-related tail fiber protein